MGQEGSNGLRPAHSLWYTHTFHEINKSKESVPQTPQLFTKENVEVTGLNIINLLNFLKILYHLRTFLENKH